MDQIKIEGRTLEERETYYQFKLAELYTEIRSLKKKVKRRDNKIIELEKKNKELEKLLYKLGLRPLQIKFVPDGYLKE